MDWKLRKDWLRRRGRAMLAYEEDDPRLLTLVVSFALCGAALQLIATSVGPFEGLHNLFLIALVPVGVFVFMASWVYGATLIFNVLKRVFPRERTLGWFTAVFLFFALSQGWSLGCDGSRDENCVPGYIDLC